jgi:TRAP-type C4-dicarboxylate transport system permease small subunit
MTGRLAAVDRGIAATLRWGCIAALFGMLALLSLGVAARAFPVFSMSGYDEIIELLMAWLTFAGAAALWREAALFRVGLVEALLPAPAARLVDRLVALLMLGFALVFTWQGWVFAAGALESVPFLGISKQPWYAALPASGLLMVVYAVAGLVGRVAPEARSAGLSAQQESAI